MLDVGIKLHWISRRVADWAFGSIDQTTAGQAADVFRRGRLGEINVQPGTISTTARSGRSRPYVAYISMPELSEEEWAEIESELAADPLTAAEFAAGRLSDAAEEILGHLVPNHWEDVTQQCTCDDWSIACRHAVALTMALAQRFAKDPMQLIEWRGRERADIIDRVSRLQDTLTVREQTPLDNNLSHFFDSPTPLPAVGEPIKRVDILSPNEGLREDEDEAWLAETLEQLSAYTRDAAARRLL